MHLSPPTRIFDPSLSCFFFIFLPMLQLLISLWFNKKRIYYCYRVEKIGVILNVHYPPDMGSSIIDEVASCMIVGVEPSQMLLILE